MLKGEWRHLNRRTMGLKGLQAGSDGGGVFTVRPSNAPDAVPRGMAGIGSSLSTTQRFGTDTRTRNRLPVSLEDVHRRDGHTPHFRG
jgi:hypothetical protein